tara:strand:- start:330 stop:512 length:183 start_codon:yes stop_codon:yes gene_type:complete
MKLPPYYKRKSNLTKLKNIDEAVKDIQWYINGVMDEEPTELQRSTLLLKLAELKKIVDKE